jgi:DNA replication protein DnaC
MKDPEQEQEVLDRLTRADILVLDNMGSGPDSSFSRSILQEILDGRLFRDRAGLVVTSKYSINQLADKMADDTIPSRLAGMCWVIEVRGQDGRLVYRMDREID